MGRPGSDGQTTLMLKNAAMSETFKGIENAGHIDDPTSHKCEPNPDGTLCESANLCAFMRRWRAARVQS